MCSSPTLKITGRSALTGRATRRSARPSNSNAAVPAMLRAAAAQIGVMYCNSSLLTIQVKPQASTTTPSSSKAWRRESAVVDMAGGSIREDAAV